MLFRTLMPGLRFSRPWLTTGAAAAACLLPSGAAFAAGPFWQDTALAGAVALGVCAAIGGLALVWYGAVRRDGLSLLLAAAAALAALYCGQGDAGGGGVIPLALAAACLLLAALLLVVQVRVQAHGLGALNRALEQRVAERTETLNQAKQAAESANRSKSEFLAMMSHEIRTPLHGLAGLAELLDGTALSGRQRQYVRLLKATADDLTLLISDILDMSRIEAGRLDLDPAPFRLADVLESLAAVGHARAAEKGLHFAIDRAEGLPDHVSGDRRALRQILFAFLDNAFKFTESGSVSLTVAPGGRADMIRFAVHDTGPGIPSDRVDELFQPFTQIDASDTRRHQGSGLGLAICQRLCALMGGQLGVVPHGGGIGATFWVEVSLPHVQAEPVPQPVDRTLPAGLRILFADDMPLNRMVFRDFLDGTGCVIEEAADGAQAVAMATEHHYDVLVLDLRMPGMDGFQAARAIREDERKRGIRPSPIVALTAGTAASDRLLASEAGFDAFLAKPIARQALIEALADLIHGLPARHRNWQVCGSAPQPPAIPDGLEHLLPAFLAEMEKDGSALQDIVARGNRGELVEFAHAMRGKCGLFGENPLFVLLTRLEAGGDSLSAQQLQETMGEIAERLGQLKQFGEAR